MKRLNKQIVAAAIATCFLLCACDGGTVYSRLGRTMKNVTDGDTVTVEMTRLFKAEWDTMYVFVHPDIVPEYQSGQGIARRIVFTKDGRTVHTEDEESVNEPYKVEFHSKKYYYTPKTAVFEVYKDVTHAKPHFVLTPVDEIIARRTNPFFDDPPWPEMHYELKGGFHLHEYTLDHNEYYCVRLTGGNIDTVITETPTYPSKYARYTGVDFDDYFALTWYSYHLLFDKRTGEQVLKCQYTCNYDLENNLMFTHSGESDEFVLLNLKTWKEVVVSDYFQEKHPDIWWVDSHKGYHISKVTQKYIIITFKGCEETFTFRIPRNKIEL